MASKQQRRGRGGGKKNLFLSMQWESTPWDATSLSQMNFRRSSFLFVQCELCLFQVVRTAYTQAVFRSVSPLVRSARNASRM